MPELSSLQVKSVTEWASLYQGSDKRFQIPGSSEMVIDPQPIIRQMYVNLAQVIADLKAKNITWIALTIYADVVEIPSNYCLLLEESSISIIARRIEVIGNAEIVLMFPDKEVASLVIYTNEVGGCLAIRALLEQETNEMWSEEITQVTSLGFQVEYSEGKVSKTDLDFFPFNMREIESNFYKLLVTSFQYATIFAESRKDIACDILAWIKISTSTWLEMQEMFLQSSALFLDLKAASGNVTFVPYLSRSQYQELSKAFTDAAGSFEVEYDNFRNANLNLVQRQKSASLMLGYFTDTEKFSQKLIDQANENLSNAKQGFSLNISRMSTQKDKLEEAKKAFEVGLEVWKAKKQKEAAFEGVKAGVEVAATLVGLVASVTTVVVGFVASAAGGAGVPVVVVGVAGATGSLVAIGATVANAAQSTTAIAKAAKALEIILKLIEALGKAIEAMGKILAMVENIEKAVNKSDLLNQINQLTDLSKPVLEQSDDVSWSVFEQEIGLALKMPVDEGVNGAAEYLKELHVLAIYGKAINGSQRTFIELTQQLVRLKLEKEVSEKQVNRIQDYVKDLEAGKQPNAEMIQLFYQRYLNVKRWLFVAIENHNAAYKYWALREPSFTPSMMKRVSELKKDLATIQNDLATALKGFDPRPQDMEDITCVLSDPEMLEIFKKTGKVSWNITLDQPEFEGCNRVRITRVRAWINGAISQTLVTKKLAPITVSLSTSGNFYDRYKGQKYEFMAAPLQRQFKYTSTNQIIIDGEDAEENKHDYYQPTPFTTWVISLPQTKNTGIDLTNVDQIKLEFKGSLIPE
ncbi:hypothetical protein DSM106972_027210 [Dulcicalothrix desertica PCC 7102]|uniref:Uncharacterized protein n=1 Tax=Dulcicalothrix desertica PCC 7102 TaxID=232991 RepID=A0A3S1CFP8_9CYAN|nr:hypothetical protein [Dulcicalothrix desertica]RUT06464.1 hypothetical protein DSM106972_027210 [Dulcicalothrix desertica PCC 7102]TWH62646.1 hypothetical protein CAL7102_00145 [Dulcicalothrix desertica PCC 7102]